MPVFYTEKERKAALKQMHINPDSERVSSTEAVKILGWRAKTEHGIEHEYNANAIRKHGDKLDARPALKSDGSVNTRQNTYDVKKLFEIDIVPARTNKGPGKRG
jgi:hypothetical protein